MKWHDEFKIDYFLLLFIFLFLPSIVIASGKCDDDYSPAEETLYDHLEEIKNNKTHFFYSEYVYYDKDLKEDIMISLIIEMGKKNGYMIDKDKCTVTNLSTISYSEEHSAFVVDDTHGGVATYKAVDRRLQRFLNKKFILLKPVELTKKLRIRPPKLIRK